MNVFHLHLETFYARRDLKIVAHNCDDHETNSQAIERLLIDHLLDLSVMCEYPVFACTVSMLNMASRREPSSGEMASVNLSNGNYTTCRSSLTTAPSPRKVFPVY